MFPVWEMGFLSCLRRELQLRFAMRTHFLEVLLHKPSMHYCLFRTHTHTHAHRFVSPKALVLRFKLPGASPLERMARMADKSRLGVSENLGYLIWGPYNKDPTI